MASQPQEPPPQDWHQVWRSNGIWWVIFVFLTVIWMALIGFGYADLLIELVQRASDPEASAEIQRKMFNMQREMWGFSSPRSIAFAAFSYVAMIFWTSLMVTPAGVAYRFLKGTEGGD